MKLTVLLLTVGLLNVYATGVSQNISFSGRNASLEIVFTSVEKQTDFVFMYSRAVLKSSKPVSIDVQNVDLKQFLYQVFKSQPLKYLIEDKNIFIYPKLVTGSSERQTTFFETDDPLPDTLKEVKGRVVDKSGNPLAGVSIVATVRPKELGQSTMTDEKGWFKLQLKAETAVLVFSAVGYISREIDISNHTEINVVLTESRKELDEVVVVGYGSQSKRLLTTSVTKISGKAVESSPINNIGDGLKGKVAGVRVYTNNNQPGAAPIINIRGGSSINRSNVPLVIVDGFVRTLDDINTNDIESIEVLKDAASTAIYGSRASNGVVIITTKKGSVKNTAIDFEVMTGHQGPERNYDYLNAKDYITYGRPALRNSNFSSYLNGSLNSLSTFNDEKSIYTTRYLKDGESVPSGWQSMIDPLDNSKILIFQDNNFRDIVYRSSMYQNYYIGITGGKESVSFAGSAGYTQDDGIAIGTGWKRFSATGNADISAGKKMKVTLGFNFSESHTDQYDNQFEVISRGMSTPPTQRVYWDDGTPTRGYNATSPTPVWYASNRINKNRTNRFAVNTLFTYNILKGLDLKVSGSYFNTIPQIDYFEKANEFSSSRIAKSNFSYNTNLQSETYLSFNRVLGSNHSLSAVAGFSYLKMRDKSLRAEAMGSNTDYVTTLNGSPIKNEAYTYITNEVLEGYFGRLSYAYLGRYMLMGTFRYDGSSKFMETNRWGLFPGISGGWIVSEEPFFNVKNVNLLKIRSSYGLTGNNSIGLYDAAGVYSVDYIYNGSAGIRSTTMPNENLRWETTKQFDLGADIELFNSRIAFSADYFNKITNDLIFSKPLPNTSGYTSVLSNIGKVRFYGFDLSLTSVNIKKTNFSWNSTLTLTFIKNVVLQLPENGRDKNRIGGYNMPDGSSFGGIAEGEPLYRFYGYKVEGILQDDAKAASARFDELAGGYNYVDGSVIKGRKFAGDYEWQDRNGDGIINSLDQFEIGVTVPHITGGLNNEFRYKRFTFNIYTDWALGHSIYDENYQRQFMLTFEGNWALNSNVAKTWQSSGDNTQYARLQAGSAANTSRNYYRVSDNFTFKGDYLCIRELKVMYDLPVTVANKIGSNGISIYLSGINLHYFTSSIGVSPEVGTSTTFGRDYFAYPPSRKVVIGAKIKF